LSANSEIWQQGWHHPTVVMGIQACSRNCQTSLPCCLRVVVTVSRCALQTAPLADCTPPYLALDDGRPQRPLGSVVGGLDSLNLQAGPQRINHLQELMAGAHRAGLWRSIATLNAQLHHLLEVGLKGQPDRLAAVLQHRPVD